MAKPRTPTNVLTLHGAFKENPARGRERANEPEEEAIDLSEMEPPATLSQTEAYAWRELRSMPYPGTVTARDVLAFTSMVKVWSRIIFREYWDNNDMTQLRQFLALFGMTPADRSRVAVLASHRKGKAADPDDEFGK